jgi:uncharacterized membrane protein
MYGILIALHNVVAWVVLATGAFVLLKAFSNQNSWTDSDTGWVRRLTLLVHLQLLAGLALWFTSPTVAQARTSMGTTMKDAALRRLVVEHPTLMILAAIVATVTGVLVRKSANGPAKARRALIGTLTTLLLISAVIPWARLVTSWTSPS